MYSYILPIHTSHRLQLEKERLKAQLNTVSYQDNIDKAIIEHNLQEIRNIKKIIEEQATLLHSTLIITKQDVQNRKGDKNKSLKELRVLGLEVMKEEKKMEDIIGSSVRQQEANTVLAKALLKLQNQSDALQEQKNILKQKIENTKRQLLISEQNTKNLRTKNVSNRIFIRQTEPKNIQLKNQNSKINFQINQSLLVINKINADIVKINDYNNKLKSINNNVKANVLKLQNEGACNQKMLYQLQQRLVNAETNYKNKFVVNDQNIISNKLLTQQNYQLYQQNKVLALQEASDREIWEYLTKTNIHLKTFLNQKKILNKHTQSVLYLPETSQHQSKISNKSAQNSNIKSLGSTGAFY